MTKVDEEQGSSLRSEVNSTSPPSPLLKERGEGKVGENRKISGSPAGTPAPNTFPSSMNSSTRRVGNDAGKALEMAKNVIASDRQAMSDCLVVLRRNYT